MSYVQIIEFVTRQPDEMKALGDKYIADTEGKRTATRSTIYMDQAEPHRYIAVVEFPASSRPWRTTTSRRPKTS